jgi:ABC-type lipoprotein release transport system permease subunit
MSNQSKIIGAVVAVLLIVIGLASFFANKSTNTITQNTSPVAQKTTSVDTNSDKPSPKANIAKAPEKEKSLAGNVDISKIDTVTDEKMNKLMEKQGKITLEEILSVIPENEKTELSKATQEQKDTIVDSWNALKDAGGDISKMR